MAPGLPKPPRSKFIKGAYGAPERFVKVVGIVEHGYVPADAVWDHAHKRN